MCINIAICDDEELARKKIGNAILTYFSNKEINFKIYYYSSGLKILEAQNDHDFSFIFLDIDLKDCNGVEIAKKIRNIQTTPINIVFVTSYAEYRTKVLSIHTFDYILKPISNEAIYKVMDDLMFWHANNSYNKKVRLRFKTIVGFITIYKDDILYFEYANRRINIVTKDKTYYMYGKMKDLFLNLKKYNFVMPHAAYIVNFNEISKYLKSDNQIFMTNGKNIPVSQLRSKQFRKDYMNFIDEMSIRIG